MTLPPLPTDEEIVAAVEQINRHGVGPFRVATANAVAHACKITGARRMGNGANGPRSWSGTMSPALRVAPRLAAMVQRGDLMRYRHQHRWEYVTVNPPRSPRLRV